MSERPTYLPMLEAIANAEGQGHDYYQAWYEHATDPDLKETMRVVANRELEHSLAFRKRIDELGFECQPAEILDFSKQTEIVTSDCSDWEKLQALELTDLADKVADPKNDPFGKLFRDLTIDIQTGALLGRYIAEERDSARMLASCRVGHGGEVRLSRWRRRRLRRSARRARGEARRALRSSRAVAGHRLGEACRQRQRQDQDDGRGLSALLDSRPAVAPGPELSAG